MICAEHCGQDVAIHRPGCPFHDRRIAVSAATGNGYGEFTGIRARCGAVRPESTFLRRPLPACQVTKILLHRSIALEEFYILSFGSGEIGSTSWPQIVNKPIWVARAIYRRLSRFHSFATQRFIRSYRTQKLLIRVSKELSNGVRAVPFEITWRQIWNFRSFARRSRRNELRLPASGSDNPGFDQPTMTSFWRWQHQ